MIKQTFLLIIIIATLNAKRVSLQFNNDVFVQTDRHYTYGLSLSWLDDTITENNSSSKSFTKAVKNIFDTISLNSANKPDENYTAGISFNQFAITPHNKELSFPQYQDMPYVGHTSLSLFYFEWNRKSFNEYRLDLGVTGEYAGTKYVQNIFHKMIGNKNVDGWDTQLKSQLSANVLFRYGQKSYEAKIGEYDFDWFNQFGIELGNFSTDAFAGTAFRIGKNYKSNFNVCYPYLKRDASLLESEKNTKFGYSLSIGLSGAFYAYSYILNEARKEGYDMDNNKVDYSLYSGVDLYFPKYKFTFFYQSQSEYTAHNDNIDFFGGFIFSYPF